VKFGYALSRAFRVMRSKTYWSFSAGAWALQSLPMLAGMSVYALTIPKWVPTGSSGAAEASGVVWMVVGIGAMLLGVALSLLPGQVFSGGSAYLANALMSGQPVTAAEGWSVGWRHAWRLLGIRLLAGLVTFAASLVIAVPLTALVAAGAIGLSSGDSPETAFGLGIVALIVVGLVFYLVLMAFAMIVGGWTELSVLYGVLGGRTVGEALRDGLRALKARFWKVILFLLIIVGIAFVYQIATSIVTFPLQMATSLAGLSKSGAAPTMSRGYLFTPLVYAVTLLVGLPLSVYLPAAWVAFFRQLTGAETAPVPVFAAAPVAAQAPVSPPVPVSAAEPQPEPQPAPSADA